MVLNDMRCNLGGKVADMARSIHTDKYWQQSTGESLKYGRYLVIYMSTACLHLDMLPVTEACSITSLLEFWNDGHRCLALSRL